MKNLLKNEIEFSQTLCTDIVMNMPDGFIFCEMLFDTQQRPIDWIYVLVNTRFEEITGLKNIKGKKSTELIPDIARSNPEFLEICGRVALGGSVVTSRVYLSRWFSISVYCPMKNHFVAIFKETTEQDPSSESQQIISENFRIEKERIINAQNRSLAIFNNIPDGIVVVDLNGIITHVNPAAESMLHWNNQQIIGRNFYDSVPLVDADGLIPPRRNPLQIAMMTGRPFTSTIEDAPIVKRQDNSEFSAIISTAPVPAAFSSSSSSSSSGGVVVFHDITREKELDHMRNEFISIASHQLRTPLSTISWYAEALLALHLGPLLDSQLKYVKEIAHMNTRMTELVNALLNVSRIDLGTFKIRQESVCISDIADTVLLELVTPINARSVHIQKDYSACKKNVITDPNIVYIIFQNLLTNAVIYNKKNGFIKIRIITNSEAHITISDTGCGISKKDQSSIFGKFFRADNAREIEPGGTGVGLYIVRSLLRRIGGSVWFESTENVGSTFHVIIPTTSIINSPKNIYEQ